MAKVTLGSFINKLESKFEKSHEAWEKAQKTYWEKFTKYSQTDRFKYSPDGLREIDEQYKKDKEKFEEDIATIQKDFKEYAEQIEKDAGKIFDRLDLGQYSRHKKSIFFSQLIAERKNIMLQQ